MLSVKKSSKLKLSIAFLVFFMTIGYILLLLAYSGPRWICLIVFLIYLFVLYFLIVTTRRVVKALKEKE